ncbi:MAG: histidinol-phosphate transaminase [Planctomycetaceae bacterium]|nr:histidinol-phosphate transaminase [Planctomycetaceae bacterium]
MSLFRPAIERMAGYTPGEQPQDSGWIKLNTNENPYPPSPAVLKALHATVDSGRLHLYPDPLAKAFRQAAAEVFQVDPDWILPGNGSDEVLTILTRTFVDPGQSTVYPYPSYILYETLADIQDAGSTRWLLNPDWSFNWSTAGNVLESAKLVFIPNPNSPSGNRWSDSDILRAIPPSGMLVLDEAYGDFADSPHRGELLRQPRGERIVITRTFSKSYSLAGIRFGFAIAHPDVIAGMQKAKDSYNCDALSLAAATAAMRDQNWMQANVAKIRATRARLAESLTQLGFAVTPSQTNFIWCTYPGRPHRDLYDALKSRKILVRYMKFPGVDWAPDGILDGLRISIGTDDEINGLLTALRHILSQ